MEFIHTSGDWSIGVTLLTPTTKKWTAEQIAENDEIENRTVFSNFHSLDNGRSRYRICICNCVEDAVFISKAPSLLKQNIILREALEKIDKMISGGCVTKEIKQITTEALKATDNEIHH